jgi:hypothetical protein
MASANRPVQLTCPKVYYNKATTFSLEKGREVFLGADVADRHGWAGWRPWSGNECGGSPNRDDYARTSHKTMINRLIHCLPNLEVLLAGPFVFSSGS